MCPCSRSVLTIAGFTSTMSPTRPMSTGLPSTRAARRTAVMVCASSPVIPTARGPCALMWPTSSRWTRPLSTMRTTSMVSGVVTRSPASKRVSRPRRSSMALICGPPPCTTTGRRPVRRSSTMSWAKARCRSASTMALPPNLTTTTAPRGSRGRISDPAAGSPSVLCATTGLMSPPPSCAASRSSRCRGPQPRRTF
jgi:hypothetical protein